jgi:signal transduction histidine kinase
MSPGAGKGSLRNRLLLTAAAAMLVAIALAGLAIAALFDRHVERRAIAEANNHQRTLLSAIELAANGKLKVLQQPSDPLFDKPYSGLYWQISKEQETILRSRSLWDFELAMPADDLAEGARHVHTLDGPDGAKLLAVERKLVLTFSNKPQNFRVTVAMDRASITKATSEFSRELAVALLALATFLALASYLQVTIGLQPLSRLRRDLASIRQASQTSGTGQASANRLKQNVPVEVLPLVNEINGLLDEQEQSLAKVRASAADLAHGLKTPLTALDGDIRSLRSKGETRVADQIECISDLMKRHINAVLARARIAGARRRGADSLSLRKATEDIIAVAARTPNGANLSYDLDMEPDATIEMDKADYTELMGNLIENAVRYAQAQVAITHRRDDNGDTIMVCDDGPGIDPQFREQVLRRGESLDRRGQGAGLGLSIVSEILESYGTQLSLDRSPAGGLSARFTLPRPDSTRRV